MPEPPVTMTPLGAALRAVPSPGALKDSSGIRSSWSWIAVWLLLLGSCTASDWRRDYSDPVTSEDRQPLPQPPTPANARLVVRRCLQAQRQSAKDADRRYAFAFLPDGFVQITTTSKSADQGIERVTRVYVEYKTVSEIRSETYFDLPLLRERLRVTLRGRLRRWESILKPYRSLPPLGEEQEVTDVDSLELVFDDSVQAQSFSIAMRLLGAP